MWNNRNSNSLLVGMKMSQPIWKAAWQFLAKINILLPYNPTTLILSIYPCELKFHFRTKICTRMFIAALSKMLFNR